MIEFDKVNYEECISRLSELEPKFNDISERLMPVLREYYIIRKEMEEILKILVEMNENIESGEDKDVL